MKVTVERISNKIAKIDYMVIPDSTVTICSILMKNGYKVIGKSACVDPEEFEAQLGKSLAFDDAYDQLWALEGYLLAEELSK